MERPDPVEILRRLAASRVDFVVVGMAAGVLRGAPVTTVDLDIVHRRGIDNVSRLQLLATQYGDLECLGAVGDGQSYEDLLDRAPDLELEDGLVVRVIDLPTLIELKEKAGRPKDLAALPVLRATLDETRRRS
jgi:hypothetical protein